MPIRPSPECVSILEKLISFDSVSRNSNLDLITWVAAYLETHGVASHLIHDAKSKKANLFATIGEGTRGGVVLSGHTDVVPVDGQAWSTDPFKLHEADGKLYGRGACDMKGYLAAILAAVPALAAAKLSRPVHLAFSYDEEVGCKGVHGILEHIRSSGIEPAGCIVGEPSMMRVVDAHKGSRNYLCHVTGLEGHACYLPRTVNAIFHASRLISHIHDISDEFEEQGPFDAKFDIPHDTLTVNLIKGGLARNIIPKDCEFVFGYRYLPTTDPDRIFERIADYARQELLPGMRRKSAQADISFSMQSNNPPLIPKDEQWIAFATRLSGQEEHGERVSFMTEAGLFQRAGIPCVVCGPGHIAQAHKPDEFVSLEQLAQCEQMLERLREALLIPAA